MTAGSVAGALRGRVALVTGSTSGIGLEIARALARAGADVVVHGLAEPSRVADISGELSALGVRCCYDGADLRHVDEIEAMMQRSAQTLGPVDILVNNAGVQHVAPVDSFPVEHWDEILAVNLSAAFHTTRLVLPTMRHRGWGRIVNIASAHGLVASVHKAAYIAAKHGLIGLTRTVALETARTAITCNAVCPGWVRTPLTEAQIRRRAEEDGTSFDTAMVAVMQGKQPSEQFIDVEDIAATVLFLCSDAASQVRGAAWAVDGGWTAQ